MLNSFSSILHTGEAFLAANSSAPLGKKNNEAGGEKTKKIMEKMILR
jgi:hypothetical protein